jgi:8-oxo-dGTP diphosphatase
MAIQQVCVVYLTRQGLDGPEVLLGRKLTGLGVGKVVAPGGKLESGETPAEAARRELQEEVGAAFACTDLLEVGTNRYRFPTNPGWDQDSHVFTAAWTTGHVQVSAELDPFWVSVPLVPYDEMWTDARFWLPTVLAGGRCDGDYVFASDLTSLA